MQRVVQPCRRHLRLHAGHSRHAGDAAAAGHAGAQRQPRVRVRAHAGAGLVVKVASLSHTQICALYSSVSKTGSVMRRWCCSCWTHRVRQGSCMHASGHTLLLFNCMMLLHMHFIPDTASEPSTACSDGDCCVMRRSCCSCWTRRCARAAACTSQGTPWCWAGAKTSATRRPCGSCSARRAPCAARGHSKCMLEACIVLHQAPRSWPAYETRQDKEIMGKLLSLGSCMCAWAACLLLHTRCGAEVAHTSARPDATCLWRRPPDASRNQLTALVLHAAVPGLPRLAHKAHGCRYEPAPKAGHGEDVQAHA